MGRGLNLNTSGGALGNDGLGDQPASPATLYPRDIRHPQRACHKNHHVHR